VLGVGVGVGVTGVGVGVGVTGVVVGVGVIVGVGVFDGHNPILTTSNGAPYCSTNIFLPQI
jgi:hypothetical protein